MLVNNPLVFPALEKKKVYWREPMARWSTFVNPTSPTFIVFPALAEHQSLFFLQLVSSLMHIPLCCMFAHTLMFLCYFYCSSLGIFESLFCKSEVFIETTSLPDPSGRIMVCIHSTHRPYLVLDIVDKVHLFWFVVWWWGKSCAWLTKNKEHGPKEVNLLFKRIVFRKT